VKARLLIADDSATTQKIIQLCFADEAAEVRAASDGVQAIDLFHAWRPDVVLVDVLLPGIDGYEICARIKQESQTPVVLLVGTFEPFDFDRAEASGYDAYLTKPFDTTQLVRVTLELAARSTAPGVPVTNVAASAPETVEKRIGILRFEEVRSMPTPHVLQINDLRLTPWEYQVVPQSVSPLPNLPNFEKPEVPTAVARSAEEVSREASEVFNRLLPRWMEGIRAELIEELKRNPPGPASGGMG
jgi:CheY-like chemotaxis protein